MTLLLTCVTQKFVVQASDRRLTTTNGKLVEDAANKATRLCNFASFAFTGLADLGYTRTESLVLNSLRTPGRDIQQLIFGLAKAATDTFSRIQLPAEYKRTSFVGAGYLGLRDPRPARDRPDDEMHPFIAVISNAQDLTEAWRAQADPEFKVHLSILRTGVPFSLHAAGQPFDGAERINLERTLRKNLERMVYPETIARLLARAIRAVAAKNPAVGSNVMCSIVRRSEAKDDLTEVSGGAFPVSAADANEAGYFQSLPPHDSKWIYSPGVPEATLFYGPNVACNGFAIKGIRAQLNLGSGAA